MPAERRTRGSYSAGLATRESILETSMRLIADSGYHGFSLRDVGRSVGISHPAVIYHFPSKEALLLAVVQRYEREFGLLDIDIDEDTGAIIEKGIRADSIAELALAMMRLAKHPDARTIMALDCVLGVEAASPTHPAHDHFAYRFEALHSFLATEMERLLSAGTVNFDLTPASMACALVRDWYGMAVHARYLTGEEAERHTIAGFLAASSRTLELRPEVVLTLAASIPEDLADVFARSLKIYRDMHA